jgi:hypothetical protein
MSEPSEPEYRVDNPAEAFDRLKAGVKQALTVSKPEIVRREQEAKKTRQSRRQGKTSPL